MILGKNKSEIVKLAVENQSEMFDGVVQYDYEDQELFGCSFSTGTIENPANPFIEVFRLPQGEEGVIDYGCDDCKYRETKCCMEEYIDYDFEEDFEENFMENLERQIRDVLHDHLGESIEKLNEIRVLMSDKLTPHNYITIRGDNWEENTLDMYVDWAIEDGFSTLVEPRNYLDYTIQHLINVCDYCDDPEVQSISGLLFDFKLDEAIEKLQ